MPNMQVLNYPSLLQGVACREVRDGEPWGLMGKAGTFPPGPLNIYRFMEFEAVSGHHDLELVAYWALLGSQNYEYHSRRQDAIDASPSQTTYRVWFDDNRTNGNWREEILLDGQSMGVIEYTVGGIGE